ncbi:TetR/AcrR family transcriptional regulator [Gordonia desulfuricans]|uniref:TetR/AcrR family transcriptional regulator n=1 Tax=Gordonia desulfuricans TaxID=89051 RepID=A0A7K3LRM7_9ACTN|nr:MULTISPECIES: TetR/AcrR family transcriptional regulator [Gordonia]EMP15158.2 TetR family transcriptional regulator [Gordonia sp. NB41Y]NDK90878.1 TetR/AcrR family transcriptional regulator [Gordonia desulfuricans]WLP91139.1 helix-turn-helix domain-containing protein [Gordonia sp. NB41Y]
MPATAGRATPGRGRPRLEQPKRDATTAREEILDAAAELFVRHGYSGTSTRMIADAVGVRQSSLYHHFKNKDDLLAALLETTVVGPLGHARALLHADGPALDRLLDLAEFDARQLVEARWNLGSLYLLPEVADERYAEFRLARRALADVYEQLSVAVLGDAADDRRLLPFRMVESIIMLRSDEERGELADHSAGDLVPTIVAAIASLVSSPPHAHD